MAYDGWLKFGGSEIINADRTAAYIASLTPQLQFKNCSSCPDLRYLVNRKPNLLPALRTEANLLYGDDANFEGGTIGRWSFNNFWGGASGTLANSTTRASQGTHSMLITWPTNAQNEWVPIDVQGLEIGATYVMEMDVWVPTGSPDVSIGSPFVINGETYTSVKDSWVTISATWTATWTNNSVGVWIYGPTTAGQQVWIDNVVVSKYAFPPQSGEFINETTQYTTPFLDRPEWYDPADEDTWGFAGLYPLRIRGLEDDNRTATVTEAAHDGGFISLPRKTTKEITVEGLMVANSQGSLSAGMRWLRKALDGSGCGGSGLCEGDDLCFYTACPGDIPLEGYNYAGPPMVRTVPGAYGWQAFGGTYSRNTATGVGTYTSNNAGVAYAQYSPFKTVCDTMKFTVNFVPEDLSYLTGRTNMVPNPAYRASSGTAVVRRNKARNPVGKYNANFWEGVSNLGVGSTSGTGIEAKEGGSSPNYPGQIGLQSRYVRVEATRTLNKAGAGLRTTVADLQPGVPIMVSSLVKTAITGVTKIQIRVTCFNEDGDTIFGGGYTSTEQTVVVNTWARLNFVTPPTVAGTAGAYVDFIVGSSITGTFASTQNMVYVSECLIEQANAVPNWDAPFYFDGDIGYTYTGLTRGWTGTAHNSESVLTGPALPNTLVGNDYWTSTTDWSHANSYRSGSAESTVFLMGSSGTSSAMTNLASPKMPVLAGKNYYAARVTVQHMDGPQASLGVVLRLRAYNASGTSLGIVAAAGNTTFPLSVGGTVNVTAPSTLAIPAGTTTISAEVWLNTSAPLVPTILKVSSLLVEPVAALSTQPGAFFDGETADVPGSTQYTWTGQANYSTSVAQDPVLLGPYNVALEAWAGDADDPSTLDNFVGRVDGYTSDGRISLTIEGGEWEMVAWRLVPLDTDPVLIQSVTYEWHEFYGYTNVFPTEGAVHPLGYYTESPPSVQPSIPDPIVEMLDTVDRRYFRSMRRVTAVAGPTVTQEFSSTAAHMCRVEFTLVAGVPWIYGDEIEAGQISLNQGAQAFNTYDDDTFLIAEVIPPCSSTTPTTPIVDPACATIPSPPTVPDVMAICSPSAGPVVRRYGFRIDAKDIPVWGEVVPIIQFTPVAPISQLAVKFYPTPVPNTHPIDVDPCAMCAGFVINYSDAHGIIIDGASERVYSPVAEIATGPGGAFVETGRTVERAARHLVSNLNYGPMEWPVLSCGIGYLVVVETYEDVDAMMTVNLVARQ